MEWNHHHHHPAHLDGFPLDLHRLFPEIHADGRLGLVGEAAAGEAEGETRLAHVGVSDDDDLEDPRLDAQLQGGGAQVHRGREAPLGGGAAVGSAPTGSLEIHGRRQDGHVVVGSAPPRGSSAEAADSARCSGLLLRGVVGHGAGGGDAQVGASCAKRGAARREVGEDGRMDGRLGEGRGGGDATTRAELIGERGGVKEGNKGALKCTGDHHDERRSLCAI